MQNRSLDRDVWKFLAVGGTAKQQATATHIAAPDEVSREAKTFSEVCQQHFDIFIARNTSKQNYLTLAGQDAGELTRVTLERFSITRVAQVDVHPRKFSQVLHPDLRPGVDQAARRGNDENPACTVWDTGKDIGISNFAAEIQAAKKCKNFRQGRALGSHTACEIKLRPVAHEHTRAFTAGVSG